MCLPSNGLRALEYTAGILDDEVLPLICLETPNVFYDYAAKYEADTTRYLIPCGLPAAKEAELQAMSQTAFAAIGASGWGRVDFMLDTAGQAWLIEVNTVPGLTDHSLVPMAARARGIELWPARMPDTGCLSARRAAGGEGGWLCLKQRPHPCRSQPDC